MASPPRKKMKIELNETPHLEKEEFLCPICCGVIKEAYITLCGHSFCYFCLVECLKTSNKCPKCSTHISQDKLIPNFNLNKLLSHYQKSVLPFENEKQTVKQIVHFVKEKKYNVQEISELLKELEQLKEKSRRDEEQVESEVFLEFLRITKEEKQQELQLIKNEINYLEEDVTRTENKESVKRKLSQQIEIVDDNDLNGNDIHLQNLELKKQKILECLPHLQYHYFESKKNNLDSDFFPQCLSKFTMYNRCKKLMTVRFAEPFSSSTIVSSLEFDRDEEFFATAGVNKILRVYEYKTIPKTNEISFPKCEMPCKSNISCLSWNPYLKSHIATTDYEGRVSIWDVDEGRKIISLQEHNKRAWTVSFSHTNPTMLASGSDDMTVKIWCLNQLKSTMTLQSTANVCSVAFNPHIANQIAVGLADHDIKYYDLRHIAKPLHTFSGHKKSVSYVKFLGKDGIVSASTDSTLKLWDVNSEDGKCTRTFVGHTNEKHFVGLSCNNGYIACGSENNSMYIYYKEISHPVVHHSFSSSEENNSKYFISSICWRKRDNVLLSANSKGGIKIFEVD